MLHKVTKKTEVKKQVRPQATLWNLMEPNVTLCNLRNCLKLRVLRGGLFGTFLRMSLNIKEGMMKIYIKKLFVISMCLLLVFWFHIYECAARQIQLKRESAQEEIPPAIKQQLAEDKTGEERSFDNKISLDLKGMDIKDVLKMLSLRSGMNIVAGKNVRGKVTVFLKDVDIMDALEMILISNELAYDTKGSIINVMTGRDYETIYGAKFQDKKKLKVIKLKYAKASEVAKALNQVKSRVGKIVVDDASCTIVAIDAPHVLYDMELLVEQMDNRTETKVFALNYATAETMKTKLDAIVTKGLGEIHVDERTNKVIVTDLVDNMKMVESAIAEFDERTKQVLIEAKILQITLNDEYKAGINWDVIIHELKTPNISTAFSIIDSSPVSGRATTGTAVSLGQLSSTDYEVIVEYLQVYGKTNLLSTPRILAVNNEEAKILVGRNQPYAEGQLSSTTGGITTNWQIKFIDLGISLYVTPTINSEGYVTMKIKPAVKSASTPYTYNITATDASSEESTAITNEVPIVDTSEAETTVMVKDGSTAILAGLIESRITHNESKVPILGDIPFIGNLFKKTERGDSENPEKRELIIFLTPHIISGDVNAIEVEKYKRLTDKLETQLTQEEIKEIDEILAERDARGKPKVTRLMEEAAPERTTHRRERTSNITPKRRKSRQKAPQQVIIGQEPKAEKQKAGKEISKITLDAYYHVIREKIFDYVREYYPEESISGEVYLSFVVANDGTLKGKPTLLKMADEKLIRSAVKSLRAAAPFPVFPAHFPYKEKLFKISIVYE